MRADSAEQSLIFKECGVGASLCELRSRSEPIVACYSNSAPARNLNYIFDMGQHFLISLPRICGLLSPASEDTESRAMCSESRH